MEIPNFASEFLTEEDVKNLSDNLIELSKNNKIKGMMCQSFDETDGSKRILFVVEVFKDTPIILTDIQV
jgi:hypothetical protein